VPCSADCYRDDENDEATPIAWNIRREGRGWTPEEFTVRADRLLGVEFEMSGGKLFGSEKTRRLILGGSRTWA
jgi:hypothetical protein